MIVVKTKRKMRALLVQNKKSRMSKVNSALFLRSVIFSKLKTNRREIIRKSNTLKKVQQLNKEESLRELNPALPF